MAKYHVNVKSECRRPYWQRVRPVDLGRPLAPGTVSLQTCGAIIAQAADAFVAPVWGGVSVAPYSVLASCSSSAGR